MKKSTILYIIFSMSLGLVLGVIPNQTDAKSSIGNSVEDLVLSTTAIEKAFESMIHPNLENKSILSAEDVEAMNLALTFEYLKFSFLTEYLSSGSFISNYNNEHNHNNVELHQQNNIPTESNHEYITYKTDQSESINESNQNVNVNKSSDDEMYVSDNEHNPTEKDSKLNKRSNIENNNNKGSESKSRMLSIREGLRRIREHNNNYINVLTKAIKILDGTPLPKCSYNFNSGSNSISLPDNMLMLARAFNTMSIQVYNGFQGIISNGKLREIISSMSVVQASQLTFLNLNARQDPFTEAFDTIMSARQGLSFFKKYISNCPFTVQGGTFRSLNLRPESGTTGSRVMLGVMNVKEDFTSNNKEMNSIPTPTPITSNENALKNNNTKSTTASEYCLFISGTQQVFSEYSRGCIIPDNLPGGITFVHLVKDRIRITPTKIDHVLAGPAPFDVIQQSDAFSPNFPTTNNDIINNPSDLSKKNTDEIEHKE